MRQLAAALLTISLLMVFQASLGRCYNKTWVVRAMEKYGGQLIFSAKDLSEEIEVVDYPDIRALHFGNPVMQSSMYHIDHYAIEMEYNRVMMMAILFRSPLKKVLFLGLGGGAKAKFLWKYAPECLIDTVELSKVVIDVSQQYFYVPIGDDRFKIYEGDALEFLYHTPQQTYDILFADLYVAAGISPIVADSHFFSLCERALSPGGILVWNMWSQSEGLLQSQSIQELESLFENVLLLPNPESSNCVVMAFKAPTPHFTYKKAKATAEKWKRITKMNFPQLLDYLLPYTKSILK